MKERPGNEEEVRKTITLWRSVWDDIITIRHEKKITSQAEAVRQIIVAGIEAIRGKDKQDAKDNRVRQNQHDRPGRRA